MDSHRFAQAIASDPIVVVPVGALEAHGPHLPLSADQIQAEATAGALGTRWEALLAPSLPYGVCRGAAGLPGTVSLDPSALAATARDLLTSLGTSGARRVLLLSGHAERPHLAALQEGCEAAMTDRPGLRARVLSDYEFVYELRGREALEDDGHAGLLETSRLLALAPALVGPERPVGRRRSPTEGPGNPGNSEGALGVVGDTRPASAALGHRVQEHVLARLDEVRDTLFGR